jgi:hypothetical protein
VTISKVYQSSGNLKVLKPSSQNWSTSMTFRSTTQLLSVGGLLLIASAVSTPTGSAEELRNHDLCRQATPYPPEQLDREGHTLIMGMDSCETVEGVTKGAIWQSFGMWEWDGPKAKEMTGWAIGRKLGAIQVCNELPEKATLELVLTDGKVTGWKASGQCVVTLATGHFTSMLGKTWYWDVKSTGLLTSDNDSVIK